MWQEITLWQYQQIVPLTTKPDKDWTELDIDVKKLVIITGLTEQQIDSLPIENLKKLRRELDFLNEALPEGKPKQYIYANGNRYRVVYDIRKMPCARYIESKVFSKDHVANLHKIAASMVIPQRKNWLKRWVDMPYDASNHEQYANDLQMAKFLDVYYALVFFYHLYRNWIEVSQDYMVEEMMQKGMTKVEALQVVELLCLSMDGTIQPNLLPSLKISDLKKYLK